MIMLGFWWDGSGEGDYGNMGGHEVGYGNVKILVVLVMMKFLNVRGGYDNNVGIVMVVVMMIMVMIS